MERIDRKRKEDKIEEIVEFLKENLPKRIFCFIIEKVSVMYSNCLKNTYGNYPKISRIT